MAPYRWRSSNARRGSDSLIGTQSSWQPLFWLPENCKKTMVMGVRPVQTHFLHQTFKIRPPSATIGKRKICFVALFERRCVVVFHLFFASFLFRSFFALIRVTLGFFVVFPNRSHALIRVTLGFEFFGPNKSHTTIRVTFRVKWIENNKSHVTLIWGGGLPPFLGTFWRFWGFPGENDVPDRPLRESKPAEKTVYHPRRSSQRSSRGSILHSLRV